MIFSASFRPAGVLALSVLTLGCSGSKAVDARLYHMGERVQVGPLIYNVLETEWRDEMAQKTPVNRFLIVHLTITNSGSRDATPPLFTLIHASGSEHPEFSEVAGIKDWLGLLRRVEPAGTEDGRIVFDVPSGAYKLRVSDGGEPGNENTALIDIPLQLIEPPSPGSVR